MDVSKSTTLADLAALVARAAGHGPELAARAEKAAAILLSGKVAEVAPDLYEVVSSAGADAYVVMHDLGMCPCPDFRHRAPVVNGAKLCKHRLAVLFLRKLGRPVSRPSARAERVAPFRRRVAGRPARRAA